MAKMVIWSPMQGRVLMNAQPAAGALLVRNFDWQWKDEAGSDWSGGRDRLGRPCAPRGSAATGRLPVIARY